MKMRYLDYYNTNVMQYQDIHGRNESSLGVFMLGSLILWAYRLDLEMEITCLAW